MLMIGSSWWPAGKCWRRFRHGTDGAGRHEPSIDSSADPLDGRLPAGEAAVDVNTGDTLNGTVIRDECGDTVPAYSALQISSSSVIYSRQLAVFGPLCNTSDDLRRRRLLRCVDTANLRRPKQQFPLLYLTSNSFFRAAQLAVSRWSYPSSFIANI